MSYTEEHAAAHRRLMARLKRMSPAERLESLVRAGICDRQGRLLPPYRDEDELPMSAAEVEQVKEGL